MSYEALRKGRASLRGRAYVVTVTTHRRWRAFHDLASARRVVVELRCLQEAHVAETLAWVLMPDHLHWLLRLEELPLAGVLHRFKGRSARRVNQHLGRHGAVWQRGYYDRALRRSDDLRSAARYIAADPLRAGLASRLGDYPHWDAIWL